MLNGSLSNNPSGQGFDFTINDNLFGLCLFSIPPRARAKWRIARVIIAIYLQSATFRNLLPIVGIVFISD